MSAGVRLHGKVVTVIPDDRSRCLIACGPDSTTIVLPGDPDGWELDDSVAFVRLGSGAMRFVAVAGLRHPFQHDRARCRGSRLAAIVDSIDQGVLLRWILIGDTTR